MILLATAGGCSIKRSTVYQAADAASRTGSTDDGEARLERDDEALPPPPPPAQHGVGLLAGAADWGNAENLSPEPTDFVTEQSGPFKTDGYGFEIFYHRRRGRAAGAALFIGADFAGYSHDNERSYVGYDAVTGEPSRITLAANWGYITGSARLVWLERHRPEVYAGLGLGPYMLRIKEEVEDFGVADRYESDTTIGVFLCAGLRFPFKSERFALLLDGKIHAVSFDGLGGAFAGQEAKGPIYTLSFGGDWRW
jgi:hypothetical protein